MDATRVRRTKSMARRTWYAHWRQLRFARYMGVINRFSPCPIVAVNSGRHNDRQGGRQKFLGKDQSRVAKKSTENRGFSAAGCPKTSELLLGL